MEDDLPAFVNLIPKLPDGGDSPEELTERRSFIVVAPAYGKDSVPLAKRKPIKIDRANVGQLGGRAVRIEVTVNNVIDPGRGSDTLSAKLALTGLPDTWPGQVVEQVEPLKSLNRSVALLRRMEAAVSQSAELRDRVLELLRLPETQRRALAVQLRAHAATLRTNPATAAAK